MIDVTVFQSEVGEWSKRNFGDNTVQPAHRPLLGIVEECGELVDAVSDDKLEDTLDAAGDIMVYIADYCARRDFKLSEIVAGQQAVVSSGASAREDRFNDLNLLLRYAGKLCHAHLKKEQGIRVTENHDENAKHAIGMIMRVVATLLHAHDIELGVAIKKTWDRVKLRNWKANPSTGV